MKNMLSLMDWSRAELLDVLDLAEEMREKISSEFKGKSVVTLYEKPSTRTRVSFEAGIVEMGGHPMYIDASTTQLSRGESVKDMALVLDRYVEMFVARVYKHEFLEEYAKWSKKPVINALSDRFHPCQALADVLTIIRKKKGKVKVAFIGDGNNNVTHSLMLASSLLGFDMAVGCPKELTPDQEVVEKAAKNHQENGGSLTITNDPEEAAKDADVIYADVWVSMGNTDREKRLEILKPYQVNESLVSRAKPDYIFMHCLPAHIGEEVTKKVIYSKNSVVFDQAENRLHAQKGLMKYLAGQKG